MEGQNERDACARLIEDIRLVANAGKVDGGRQWTDEERHAFDRFYERFIARVYAYCDRTVGHRLPSDLSLTEFVPRVFERLARDLNRVRVPQGLDLGRLERLLLTLFHKQVQWTLSDIRRENRPRRMPDQYRDEAVDKGRFRGKAPTTAYLRTKRQFEEMLAGRSFKERDVLLTSFRFQDGVTGEFRLPPEERDRLCRDWGFPNPNALCQYRKRKIAELTKVMGSVA